MSVNWILWGREITMQTVLCKYRMWKVCVAVWSLSLVLVALGHAEETIADGKRVKLGKHCGAVDLMGR